MKYGLIERDYIYINEAIREFPEIAEVILFGSRAKGNYKTGSDVDLAIKGDRLTYEITARFADCLNEEKPLPYFFDVVDYEAITEPKLKEHIDRVGIKIYAINIDFSKSDRLCGESVDVLGDHL